MRQAQIIQVRVAYVMKNGQMEQRLNDEARKELVQSLIKRKGEEDCLDDWYRYWEQFDIDDLKWLTGRADSLAFRKRIIREISSMEVLRWVARTSAYPRVAREALRRIYFLETGKQRNHFEIEHPKKMLVEPVYDDMGSYREGFIWVAQDNRIGFLDMDGHVAVPLVYEDADALFKNRDERCGFSDGVACVCKNGMYGAVDAQNVACVPFAFAHPFWFHDGLAAVYNGEAYGYIDKQGALALPYCYEYAGGFGEGLALVKQDGVWQGINKQGEVLFACDGLALDGVEPFVDGYARVYRDGVDRYKDPVKWFGLMDRTGQLVIPVEYDTILADDEQIYHVRIDRREGFYNFAAGVEVPCVYEDIGKFRNGIAVVEKAGYGLMNSAGGIVLPLDYAGVIVFPDGRIAVWNREPLKWGFWEDGKLTGPYFSYMDWVEGENIASVKGDGKWGYVDSRGEVLVPLEYDDLGVNEGNGFAAKKDGRWGFVDQTGRVLTPLLFNQVLRYSEDGALVCRNEEFFVADRKGRPVYEYSFDYFYYLAPNRIWVQINGKWGCIDWPNAPAAEEQEYIYWIFD